MSHIFLFLHRIDSTFKSCWNNISVFILYWILFHWINFFFAPKYLIHQFTQSPFRWYQFVISPFYNARTAAYAFLKWKVHTVLYRTNYKVVGTGYRSRAIIRIHYTHLLRFAVVWLTANLTTEGDDDAQQNVQQVPEYFEMLTDPFYVESNKIVSHYFCVQHI